MRPIKEIKDEIDRLSRRRSVLLHRLGDAPDPALTSERRALDAKIADLWEEQRATRATLRFGNRSAIIKRARYEQRLLGSLRRETRWRDQTARVR
jgi:hypothetical protein